MNTAFIIGFEKTALNAQKARELAKKMDLVPEGAWKWALRNLRKGKTPQQLGMAPKKLIQKAREIGADKVEAGAFWGKGAKKGLGQLGKGSQSSYAFGDMKKTIKAISDNQEGLMSPSSNGRKFDNLGKLNKGYLKSQEGHKHLNSLHTHPSSTPHQYERDVLHIVRSEKDKMKDMMRQGLEAQYPKHLANRVLKMHEKGTDKLIDSLEKRHSSSRPNLMPSGFHTDAPYNLKGSDTQAFLNHNKGTHHNIVDESGVGVHTVRHDKMTGKKKLRTILFNRKD